MFKKKSTTLGAMTKPLTLVQASKQEGMALSLFYVEFHHVCIQAGCGGYQAGENILKVSVLAHVQ